MRIFGVIPARFGSTRFPGKPLAIIHGKTMIERVYNRACAAKMLSEVAVATDDQRIYDHVKSFGGNVIMTSADHPSGTDRCAECVRLSAIEFDAVINIQGDEPYIHPDQIDLVASSFARPDVSISTLVKTITHVSELENVNIPKVVRDETGFAIYFSRRPIPYCADQYKEPLLNQGLFLKHIGIYGYRTNTLLELAKLPKGNLEQAESLEQLRWLEKGFKIFTALSQHENIAVDNPGDIDIIENRFSLFD